MKKYFNAALLIFLINLTSYSQTEITLKGYVFDQHGKPLPNVRVNVYDSPINTVSLSDGGFFLKGLIPGKYQLLFAHHDYMPGMLEITVNEKSNKQIEISLSAKNPTLLKIKEEITVTAEADSVIDVRLPSHRTILFDNVVSRLGTSTLAETVEKTSGVTMVGKGGYSMAPAIRGLAEHKILLLIDGVRIISERRIGTSASFLNLNNIDSIEVNRGPYSVFYGSGAIGGIVNILTKSPHANSPFRGNFELGYNTVKKERSASLQFCGSHGKLGFMIAFNGKKANDYCSPTGIIEQSRYSDYDVMLKLTRETRNSQFYLTFLDYRGIDIGKPSPTAKFKPRWYPKEKNEIFNIGYKIQNRFHLDTLNASFFFYIPMLETQKENLTETFSVEKRNLAKIEGKNFGFKIRIRKDLNQNHNLNFGIDFFGRRDVNDENTEWRFDEYGRISKEIHETSLLEARRNNIGFYINDKIQISPSITINLGARYDYINTDNLTHSENERFSRSDQSIVAYVGSTFQLTSNLSLLANVGRSFRFPTISELFYTGLTGRGTIFGNSDLKPEKSVNLDLGLRYLHGKYYASIYAFSNSISNLIQKYSPSTEEEYYYRNLSQGRISGIEGEFCFWFIKNWEFSINFHHMVGKEKDTEEVLNYIPASRLTLGAKFSPGKFWMEPKINLTDSKKNPGPLEIEIDGYALLDIVLGYKLKAHIEFLAVGRNLFNQTYRFSADEKGVDAPGRGVVLKILCSF